jgi:glycine cleavage system transcriptional repressor
LQPSSEHYLVITALGKDRSGIINAITQEIGNCGCNIEDSRFALLGENFTFIMLLSGSWNAITQIELSLPKIGVALDLLIVMKRTPAIERPPLTTTIKLHVKVKDSPGLIKRFTDLFDPADTNIAELISKTRFDKLENHVKLHITMAIQTATTANLTLIKEQFYQLCKTLNAQYTINIVDHPRHNETYGER